MLLVPTFLAQIVRELLPAAALEAQAAM